MRYFILLFFLFVNANAIIVLNNEKTIDLLNYSKIYHDLGNKESIETIIDQDHKLISTDQTNIYYCNLVPESVWIKFQVKNPTNTTISRILAIDNFSLEQIDLYKTSDNKVDSKKTTGVFHLKKFDGTVTHKILMNIEPNSTQTYYLHVKNEKLSLWFTPKLYEPKEFFKTDTLKQVIWALFFGGILALAVYHLFLFFFTRDKIYFFYLLYLIATLLQHQFSLNAKVYILPMDDLAFVKSDFYINVFYVNVFVSFTMALFVRSFLNTQQYRKIDLSLKFFIYLTSVYFLLQIFDIFTIPQVVFTQLFAPYYFLWIGFYALYKKNPQAKFFIVGWSFALLGWLSLLIHYTGIYPIKDIFPYIFETLVMIETILFAISLAYRIKNLEIKKNTLTQALLDKQKNESKRLEETVKIRTKELNNELKQNELLLKELHHRVKNNMQFITSLYTLKLNEHKDKDMEEKLQDVERKIHSMSIVHQMLFTQKNLETINAKEYFEQVVENITQSFEMENISFKLNISATLDIEEAIYCGLIVNELVTNAIKYAFDKKGGSITISLNYFDDGILLKVSDDGKGLKVSDQPSFGQMMVESLAEGQLEGKLNIKTDHGTHISLWFKNKIHQYNAKSNAE